MLACLLGGGAALAGGAAGARLGTTAELRAGSCCLEHCLVMLGEANIMYQSYLGIHEMRRTIAWSSVLEASWTWPPPLDDTQRCSAASQSSAPSPA